MLPLLFHLFLLKLFPVLQGKLVKLAQENQDEQKLLRETIDKLQKQLTDKEQELAARESALRRQQDKVEENRRKFELEKEVTLERLREDRLRFQVQFFLNIHFNTVEAENPEAGLTDPANLVCQQMKSVGLEKLSFHKKTGAFV